MSATSWKNRKNNEIIHSPERHYARARQTVRSVIIFRKGCDRTSKEDLRGHYRGYGHCHKGRHGEDRIPGRDAGKIQVRHEVVFHPHSQHQRLERLSYSSGGKEFVQGTQHGPGRSKTEPLKR